MLGCGGCCWRLIDRSFLSFKFKTNSAEARILYRTIELHHRELNRSTAIFTASAIALPAIAAALMLSTTAKRAFTKSWLFGWLVVDCGL
jgi:hypothetical protein